MSDAPSSTSASGGPAAHNAWFFPHWPAPRRVRALSTQRAGGVSDGANHRYASLNLGTHVGDDPEAVRRNRERLRAALPAEPLWLNQVHGTRVLDADGPLPADGMPTDGKPPEADAAVTRTPGRVLAVMTADCLPVLLADRAGTVVAVAHAGWRGLAAGVIENAVRAMNVSGDDIVAWLGPAIGPREYEVGSDVRDAFVAHDSAHADPAAIDAFEARANGKYLADLYHLARRRLERVGVTDVHGGDACTFIERERFFSFRRDGQTGRMASLLWLE
jgi:YfiH family protein